MKGRRKKVIVKKEFQLRFTAIILIVAIIVANLVGGLVYGMLTGGKMLDLIQKWFSIPDPEDAILPVIILAEMLSIVIVSVLGIYLSHKIAGPLFRLERVIRQLGDGDLSEHVKLREGDEFVELADAYNYAREELKDKLLYVYENLDKAAQNCEDENLEKAYLMMQTFKFEPNNEKVAVGDLEQTGETENGKKQSKKSKKEKSSQKKSTKKRGRKKKKK